MVYVIEDWAGNRVFPDKEFSDFDDGWEFLWNHFSEELDNEGFFDDLYVVNKEGEI